MVVGKDIELHPLDPHTVGPVQRGAQQQSTDATALPAWVYPEGEGARMVQATQVEAVNLGIGHQDGTDEGPQQSCILLSRPVKPVEVPLRTFGVDLVVMEDHTSSRGDHGAVQREQLTELRALQPTDVYERVSSVWQLDVDFHSAPVTGTRPRSARGTLPSLFAEGQPGPCSLGLHASAIARMTVATRRVSSRDSTNGGVA